MISLIEQSKPALAELCRRFKVSRLFVFGSGVSGRFDPDASDLDFVVELADRQPNKSYADRYLGLAEALERLFGRRVDLLTGQSIRNPYLRREVQATQELVYEQRGEVVKGQSNATSELQLFRTPLSQPVAYQRS